MSDVELRRYVEKAMMDCIKWPKLNHYRYTSCCSKKFVVVFSFESEKKSLDR